MRLNAVTIVWVYDASEAENAWPHKRGTFRSVQTNIESSFENTQRQQKLLTILRTHFPSKYANSIASRAMMSAPAAQWHVNSSPCTPQERNQYGELSEITIRIADGPTRR
jgi:hypothetical protein